MSGDFSADESWQRKKGEANLVASPLVGGTELELLDANPCPASHLGDSPDFMHANCNAQSRQTTDQQAAELRLLELAWPNLSDRTRRRILSIVQSCDRKQRP